MAETKKTGATSCPECGGSGYLPPEQAWAPCPRCHGTGQTSCPHCRDRDPFSPRRCVLPAGHDGLHRDTEEREAEFAKISGPHRELSEAQKARLNGACACDDKEPSHD